MTKEILLALCQDIPRCSQHFWGMSDMVLRFFPEPDSKLTTAVLIPLLFGWPRPYSGVQIRPWGSRNDERRKDTWNDSSPVTISEQRPGESWNANLLTCSRINVIKLLKNGHRWPEKTSVSKTFVTLQHLKELRKIHIIAAEHVRG